MVFGTRCRPFGGAFQHADEVVDLGAAFS
jgi:hypothetical protein